MTKHTVLGRIAIVATLLVVMLSASVSTAYAGWLYVYLDEYPPDWTEGHIDAVDHSTGWDGSAKHDIAGDHTAWGRWEVPFYNTSYGHWWVWIPLNYGDLDAYVWYKKYPGSAGGDTEWTPVFQELHANEWVDLGWLDQQGPDGYLELSAAACCCCLEYPQVWWDEAYLAWAY